VFIVSVIDHATGQWRRWLQCVVQQQGGHIEHFMQKLQDVTVTLDNDISQGSVVTHLRCGRICSDSIVTNFLLILTGKYFFKIS